MYVLPRCELVRGQYLIGQTHSACNHVLLTTTTSMPNSSLLPIRFNILNPFYALMSAIMTQVCSLNSSPTWEPDNIGLGFFLWIMS
jgi:hypothetical protein